MNADNRTLSDARPTRSNARASWYSRARRWMPLAGAIAVGLLALMLPAVIFFTAFSIQWVTFLVGVLVAASLALASRVSRARWLIARRDGQLRSTRERLAREVRAREHAQQQLAASDASFQLLDGALPLMLAHVDASRRVRYLNGALREWARAPAPGLEGHALEAILPAHAAAAIGNGITRALAGAAVRSEHPAGDGSRRCLLAQCLPHRGPAGEVAGVFLTLLEVEETADRSVGAAPNPEPDELQADASGCGIGEARERIAAALASDDFSLFFHDIVRINPGSPAPPLREAILRFDEEEDYHLPPGGFIGLVEEAGMLPALDAWQVGAAIRWLGATPARSMQVCALNVTAAALADAGFAGAVRQALREHHVPGAALCLIVAAGEAASLDSAAARGLRELREEGCRLAIGGFGASALPTAVLRGLEPDYVRIDAGLVVGVEADPRKAARVAAANRIAHACGAATIADCVEEPAALARLVEMGVDFAEGPAVSAASPLCEISAAPLAA